MAKQPREPGDHRIVGASAEKPAIITLFINSFFGDMVFATPNWDYRTFDFDGDFATVSAKFDAILNATNPDLNAFRARGGKLIQYHGWDDPAITPLDSISYYESVVAAMQGKLHQDPAEALSNTQKFYRLFMVPGMAHCFGGNGPNSFGNSLTGKTDPANNVVGALDRWVTEGVAPDQIIATKYQDDDTGKNALRTRPLCPYPQVARWKGVGSTDDSTNFICRAPTSDPSNSK